MHLGLLLVVCANVFAYEFVPHWKGLGQTENHGFTDLAPYVGYGESWNYSQFAGAVASIAFDPSDSSGQTVYACAVNRGLFRTTNFRDAQPHWEWLEIEDFSGSVSSVYVDPEVPSTVVVGTGKVSTGGFNPWLSGIAKSEDGGATWTKMVTPERHTSFVKVISLDGGQTVMGCANAANAGFDRANVASFKSNSGLYVSYQGQPFNLVIAGSCLDVIAEVEAGCAASANVTCGSATVFALFANGMYRSFDAFRNHTDPKALPDFAIEGMGDLVRGSIGMQQFVETSTANLISFFTTTKGPGAFSISEDPFNITSLTGKSIIGFHEGTTINYPFPMPLTQVITGQGSYHGAMVVDPDIPLEVYLSGTTWGTAGAHLGAYIIRGNLQNMEKWDPIVNFDNIPHADTRVLKLTPDGKTLALATDGNIYSCDNPQAKNLGDVVWTPRMGDMPALQCIQGGYDPVSKVSVCAAQDNGCLIMNPGGYGANYTFVDRIGDGSYGAIMSNPSDPTNPVILVASQEGGLIRQVTKNMSVVAFFRPPFAWPGINGTLGWSSKIPVSGTNMVVLSEEQLVRLSLDESTGLLIASYIALDLEEQLGSNYDNVEPWIVHGTPQDATAVYFPDSKQRIRLIKNYTGPSEVVVDLEGKKPTCFCVDPSDSSRIFVSLAHTQAYMKNVYMATNGVIASITPPSTVSGDEAVIVSCEWFAVSDTLTALVAGTNQGAFVAFFNPTEEEDIVRWNFMLFGLGSGGQRISDVQYHYPTTVPGEGDVLVLIMDGDGIWTMENTSQMMQDFSSFRITNRTFDETSKTLEFHLSQPAIEDDMQVLLMSLSDFSPQLVSDITLVDNQTLKLSLEGLTLTEGKYYAVMSGLSTVSLAKEPSVYLANDGQRDFYKAFGVSDLFLWKTLSVGKRSNGAEKADAVAAVTVAQSAVAGELSVSWDAPAESGGCMFASWRAYVYDDSGNEVHFNVASQWNPFDKTATKVTIGVAPFKEYQVAVEQRCLDRSNNSPLSPKSTPVTPVPPAARAPTFVKVAGQTATTLNLMWGLAGIQSGCEHDNWGVALFDPVQLTEFTPDGCKTIADESLERSEFHSICKATGLTPSTNYHYVKVWQICKDVAFNSPPTYTETGTIEGLPTDTLLATTLTDVCAPACENGDLCVDGACVCSANTNLTQQVTDLETELDQANANETIFLVLFIVFLLVSIGLGIALYCVKKTQSDRKILRATSQSDAA